MASILGILVLLSPIGFFAAGYYCGRYGSPIRLTFHRASDRRKLRRIRPDYAEDDEDAGVDVYRIA